MKYLHSHNVLHGNLSPSSIFFDEKLRPIIGNFDLATKNQNLQSFSFQSISGNNVLPIYLAPEVIQSKECTQKSDVYSFSLIVYEIITLEKPYKNLINANHFFEIVNNNGRPIFNKPIPDIYRKLIERCWSEDPNDRPTFDDIVHFLSNDSDFRTNNIDINAFQEYIESLENEDDKINEKNKDDDCKYGKGKNAKDDE